MAASTSETTCPTTGRYTTMRDSTMGWVRNPKRAAYNAVYKRTTFSLWDLFR
ncbi:hypothetical protein MUG60_08000 [Kaistella montana]|nr:hypothetical protein [Kaistella montana]